MWRLEGVKEEQSVLLGEKKMVRNCERMFFEVGEKRKHDGERKKNSITVESSALASSA